MLQGYQPFLLYDATTSPSLPIQPIFLQPTILYVAGGVRPTLGVAFGTGNRADLLDTLDPNRNRLTYVIDNGGGKTLHEADLRNISPAGGPDPGVGPGASNYGYYLTFVLPNEKATSQVFSASLPTPTGVQLGYLTVVTFSPDTTNPCGGQGSSYRYRFFYLTGAGGYTPNGSINDYGYQEYVREAATRRRPKRSRQPATAMRSSPTSAGTRDRCPRRGR